MADVEQFTDFHFPCSGVDLSRAFSKQLPQPAAGVYSRTTPLAVNVQSFEPGSNRKRGGSRMGLSKYISTPPNSGWMVNQLDVLVTQGVGAVQPTQSGRIVTVVAVSEGNIYYTQAGGTAWTQATNLTGNPTPLNISGPVYSATLNQKLFFVDGTNYVYFDPTTGTANTWVATQGVLPTDDSGNKARLIASWRGRLVLSGLLFDGQNVAFSAVADPFNWLYAPPIVVVTQAVLLEDSPQGLVGDNITALAPYNDDVLFLGGDHTVYQLSGDPMAGGQLDRVSDAIGFAWGEAFCRDPYGSLYFVSNKTGIYVIAPNQKPVRISQRIEQLLTPVNTGTNAISLVWDDRFQGLRVFITPTDAPAAATHLFWEQRTGSWSEFSYTNNNHNPVTVCTLDGNLPGDRVVLTGSWDGYVRFLDPTSTTDDGTAIASSVVIGPILSKDLDDMLLKDLQAVLGQSSGSVNYQILVGKTAEAALVSSPIASGTWTAGRNPNTYVRQAAHAIYVKLTSSNPWTMESIRLRIIAEGKVRRRSAT